MTNLVPSLCSDAQVEPLPGTAKTGARYVLFEWPGAWSRDILDGGTFGPELSAQLKERMSLFDATLLLIRHPTREGREINTHHCYLVFADEGITEVLHVDGPEALLDLDVSGPGRNGASARTKPMLLVCTHAKRDRCCAVKGRPLVSELAQRYPAHVGNDVVWETSHIKGHRFAATMLLMPWAFSYGRMNVEAANALIDHAMDGRYFLPGNRGRGTLPPPAQVAEVAVAQQLVDAGVEVRIDQLRARAAEASESGARVQVEDADTGTVYGVELEKHAIEGVVSSCGDAPKTGEAWSVKSITRSIR